ncbi:MAG: N-acetylglucosamine-6-phosphate deacetylase [Lachnospiraceae bacterium]|nr:N-acetylglucosamine-6-phosphate deacetylase [Candidatus Colinaster scatohippi]
MKEIKGLIFTPDFKFKPGVIYINGHKIDDVRYIGLDELGDSDREHYLIPGLIDIHMHGCIGEDVSNASVDGLMKVADYERSNGITSFCPATMTLPIDVIGKQLEIIAGAEIKQIKGVYIEGPFISEKYKGAQNSKYIKRPDINLIRSLQQKSKDLIKIVTIAPEIDGAIEMIDEGKEEFKFSIAHSASDYVTAMTAFDKGVSQVTHIYNGMPGYHHREPGIIGAAMDNTEVMVELIADGIHIHPSVVKNAFRQFGDERIVLVSDSMEATGLGDGNYSLGGDFVIVRDGVARTADGAIAGSISNLYECMKKAIAMGIRAESVIRAVTYNPAKAIGIENKVGSIAKGMDADIVILDSEYKILDIICD